MTTYQSLGPAQGGPNTASLDETGLNTGNLTNQLTGSFIGKNPPQFELYHATVTNVPSGASAQIYVNRQLYSFVFPFQGSEYDPSQPLSLRPGDEIDFFWNIPITAGYDANVLASAPLAWWKLADATGSSTAADSSGNGHTGAATAVTFGLPGPISGDTAAGFNGTTSKVLSTYDPGPLTAFSVEAWINLLGVTPAGTPRIVANSHTDVDDNGFELQLHASGLAQIWLGTGALAFNISSVAAVPASGWVYLVATWNGTTCILYVNGVQVATGGFAGPLSAGLATGIGIGYNPTYSGDFFTGDIAQVAVYGSALTAAQVLQRFQGTAQAPVVTTFYRFDTDLAINKMYATTGL